MQYVFNQNYSHTTERTTFTTADFEQGRYTIGSNQMQILTNITSNEADVHAAIDQYVGGIFIQMIYNSTSGESNYTFHKAVDCL